MVCFVAVRPLPAGGFATRGILKCSRRGTRKFKKPKQVRRCSISCLVEWSTLSRSESNGITVFTCTSQRSGCAKPCLGGPPWQFWTNRKMIQKATSFASLPLLQSVFEDENCSLYGAPCTPYICVAFPIAVCTHHFLRHQGPCLTQNRLKAMHHLHPQYPHYHYPFHYPQHSDQGFDRHRH